MSNNENDNNLHPLQPIGLEDGVLRFKRNKIVEAMYDFCEARGFTLNCMSLDTQRRKYNQEDYDQLLQLLGYSASGYLGTEVSQKTKQRVGTRHTAWQKKHRQPQKEDNQ